MGEILGLLIHLVSPRTLMPGLKIEGSLDARTRGLSSGVVAFLLQMYFGVHGSCRQITFCHEQFL